MLYNHEKNLRLAEVRITSSGISETNKQLIFEFKSNCFANGLKISSVVKHLTELKVLAEMLGKEFKDVTKSDIMKLLERIERTDRAPRTKEDYKMFIRKFFRWLEKNEVVDWIKIEKKESSRKMPEDMFSKDDIEKMINVCRHPRDRALVACLYETGTRIGEIGYLKSSM